MEHADEDVDVGADTGHPPSDEEQNEEPDNTPDDLHGIHVWWKYDGVKRSAAESEAHILANVTGHTAIYALLAGLPQVLRYCLAYCRSVDWIKLYKASTMTQTNMSAMLEA